MKTLLLFFLMTASFCLAESPQLLYGYDFNALRPAGDLAATNVVTGTDDMQDVGGDWTGYSTGYGGGAGLAHLMQQSGGTFTRSMDLSFETGFTLGANISHATTTGQNDWNNIFTVDIDSTTYHFQKNGTGSNLFSIYGGNGANANFTMNTDTWYSFTLVGGVNESGNPTLIFNLYATAYGSENYDAESQLVATSTINTSAFTADSTITSFTFGNAAGGNTLDVARYSYDNFVVYEGAASAEEQLRLASNLNSNTIEMELLPEPSSVTLSMMALLGLCARRRRK